MRAKRDSSTVQADAFARANAEEKASACSARNDRCWFMEDAARCSGRRDDSEEYGEEEWESILRGKPRKMGVLAVIPGTVREMDRRQGLKEQRPSKHLPREEAQTR